MKITLLFLALSLTAVARPPVEVVSVIPPADPTGEGAPASEFQRLVKKWRHDNGNPPRPVVFKGDEAIAGYQKGDVALWENYNGQTFAKDDLVYYTAVTLKPVQNVIREIGSINPLKTTRNFAVPTGNIAGIVRRVVRPMETEGAE